MNRSQLASRRLAFLGAGIALVVPVAVAAFAGWSAPVRISSTFFLGSLQVPVYCAMDDAANAVAVWEQDGVFGASQAPNGVWTAPVEVSGAVAPEVAFEPRVAMGPGGTAAGVWSTYAFVEGQPRRYAIKVAGKRRDGTWMNPVPIVTSVGTAVDSPRIAVNSSGDVVVLFRRESAGQSIIAALTRSMHTPWSGPVDLSAATDFATFPEIAMNDLGDAVAVWQLVDRTGGGFAPYLVQAASMTAGGGFSAPIDVSTPTLQTWNPVVAVDASRSAVAVWNQAAVIMASARASDGSWAPPVAISSAERPSYSSSAVAMDGHGNALAAWSESNGFSNEMLVAALLRGSETWRAAFPLTTADEDVSDPRLAIAADRSVAVVTWIDNATNTVRAATRGPGTAWTLGSLGAGVWSNPVSVAAAGSRARAVWAVSPRDNQGAIDAASFSR